MTTGHGIAVAGTGIATVSTDPLADGTEAERAKIMLGGDGVDLGNVAPERPLPARDDQTAELLAQILDSLVGGIETMFVGQRAPIITTQVVTDTFVKAALARANDVAVVALAGNSAAGFSIPRSGTLTATLTAEYSIDGGATWFAPINILYDPSTGLFGSTLALTSVNVDVARAVLPPPGASHVRLRVSSFTSGRAEISLRACWVHPTSLMVQSSIPVNTAVASGGNPIRTGGDDGATCRGFRTDTTGRQMAVGAAGDGVAVAGNPVWIAGSDAGGSTRSIPVAGANGVGATGGVAVLAGSQTYSVQASATVTTSGNDSVRALFGNEVTVSVAATGAVTGTNPTLQYSINEISAVDGVTIVRTYKGPVLTATSAAHRFTLRSCCEGFFQVKWVVGGTASPTFNSVSMLVETSQTTDITPQYTREYAYGAVNEAFTIAVGASGTKSLLVVLQNAGTSITRVNIHRSICTAAGGSGTGSASITFAWRRVTSVGSGGTGVVPQPSCLDSPASVLSTTVQTGATGTAGVGTDRWAEEVPLNYGRAEFDAIEHGGPLECRPGVTEGWELIAAIHGTIAQDVHVTAAVDWTEVTGLGETHMPAMTIQPGIQGTPAQGIGPAVPATPSGSRQGAMVVQEEGGRYGYFAFNGLIYTAVAKAITLAAANVSPLAAGTGQPIIGVWNPPSSGVVLEIIHGRVQHTSGTPGGPFYWNGIANQAITQATFTKAVNSKSLATGGSGYVFTNVALTGSSTAVEIRTFGGPAAIAAGAGLYASEDIPEGVLQVFPGNFVGIACKAAGTSNIVDAHMTWIERPAALR